MTITDARTEALQVIARTTFSGSDSTEDYMRGNRDAHETCAEIARAALAAVQAGAPDVEGLIARLRNYADVLFRKEQGIPGQLLRDAATALAACERPPAARTAHTLEGEQHPTSEQLRVTGARLLDVTFPPKAPLSASEPAGAPSEDLKSEIRVAIADVWSQGPEAIIEAIASLIGGKK